MSSANLALRENGRPGGSILERTPRWTKIACGATVAISVLAVSTGIAAMKLMGVSLQKPQPLPPAKKKIDTIALPPLTRQNNPDEGTDRTEALEMQSGDGLPEPLQHEACDAPNNPAENSVSLDHQTGTASVICSGTRFEVEAKVPDTLRAAIEQDESGMHAVLNGSIEVMPRVYQRMDNAIVSVTRRELQQIFEVLAANRFPRVRMDIEFTLRLGARSIPMKLPVVFERVDTQPEVSEEDPLASSEPAEPNSRQLARSRLTLVKQHVE